MKKILMIAPCSLKNNVIGGAVAKNKIIYNYLKSRYDVTIIDTYWRRDNVFQFIYMRFINKLKWIIKIAITVLKADAIVLGSNEDNYIRILYYLCVLNRTSLFSIGGIVPNRIRESKLSIEVWKQIKNIFVESEEIKSELQGMGLMNAQYLSNCKQLPKCNEVTVKENKDVIELFYHGRICVDKGIDCLLKAVDMVNATNIKCKLYLYGDFEDGYKIAESTDDSVVYGGKLNLVDSFNDYEILKKHDVFIFPSKWRAEGLSGSLLDALAIGKPVIATRHNFNEKMVREGYNGYLFDIDNVKQLMQCITKLYDNQNIIYEFGNHSLLIADEFRIENVLDGIGII